MILHRYHRIKWHVEKCGFRTKHCAKSFGYGAQAVQGADKISIGHSGEIILAMLNGTISSEIE